MLTVAGCAGAPGGTAAPFVYSAGVDVVTDWDPATSYSNEIIAMQNIYESLTRYDSRTGRVTPGRGRADHGRGPAGARVPPGVRGAGPYTVVSWRRGEEAELRLRAVGGYWGGWSGARFRNVEFRVTPEATTAWQLLRRGEVTFADRLSPQLFAQAERTEGVRTARTTSFQNLLVLFNTASGPLRDPRVRRAVQRAIDYDGLLAVLGGAVVPASGIVPQGLFGYAQWSRARSAEGGERQDIFVMYCSPTIPTATRGSPT